MNGVLEQYTRFVKPAFDEFVAPSRKFADVIIPWQRCECVPQCITHRQWQHPAASPADTAA